MGEIKNASAQKGDSKPKIDAKDIGQEHGTELGSISSIGEKNVSTNEVGGGDGSLPGKGPNEFIDPRDVHEDSDTGSARTKIDDAE